MRKLLVILLNLSFLFTKGQQTTNSTFYFDFATTKLTGASQKEIKLLIDDLQNKSISKIIINGYADKKGSAEFNTQLSYDRADSIMQLLKRMLQPGIEMSVIGFGSNKPVSEKEEEQYLNRRVEMLFEYHKIKDPVVELEGFKEDVQEQHFVVNFNDTINVTGKDGTMIKIAPQSIQDKFGKMVTGNGELIIKEYYYPDQIIMAGLHTNSDKGLLQTGGMICLTIVQHGDTMDNKTRKPVEIRMPVINDDLKDMNVFSLQKHDTKQWNNTGLTFSRIKSYWAWPVDDKLEDLQYDGWELNFLRVGKTVNTKYTTENPLFDFNGFYHPYAKKVDMDIYKIDSNTVKIHAKIKYRSRGRRNLGIRYLDTTFTIVYIRSAYDGLTENLNLINCDRFYEYKNKTDLYASTPGYTGLNVMIYFKSIHSFLPAYFDGNKFIGLNVPAGMPIVLVALGKKGDDYYFGKQEFITKKENCPIKIAKSNKEDFANALKNL